MLSQLAVAWIVICASYNVTQYLDQLERVPWEARSCDSEF